MGQQDGEANMTIIENSSAETTPQASESPAGAPKAKKVKKVAKAAKVVAKGNASAKTAKKTGRSDSMIQQLRQFVIRHPDLSVTEIEEQANDKGIAASAGTVRTVAYHTRQTLEALEGMKK